MVKSKVCSICLKFYKSKKSFLAIFKCQDHIFCHKCCNDMFAESCNTFKKPLVCPDCSSDFDIQSDFFNLKQNRIKRRFMLSKFNRKRIICPTPECNNLISMQNQKNLCCSSCNEKFCPVCLNSYHQISICPQYIEKLVLLQKFDYKTCRKCLMVVEKNVGCQHIKCLCGFQFCYGCGNNWEQNHLCPHIRNALQEQPRVNRQYMQRRNQNRNRQNYSSLKNKCFIIIKYFLVFVIIFKVVLFLIGAEKQEPSYQTMYRELPRWSIEPIGCIEKTS